MAQKYAACNKPKVIRKRSCKKPVCHITHIKHKPIRGCDRKHTFIENPTLPHWLNGLGQIVQDCTNCLGIDSSNSALGCCVKCLCLAGIIGAGCLCWTSTPKRKKSNSKSCISSSSSTNCDSTSSSSCDSSSTSTSSCDSSSSSSSCSDSTSSCNSSSSSSSCSDSSSSSTRCKSKSRDCSNSSSDKKYGKHHDNSGMFSKITNVCCTIVD